MVIMALNRRPRERKMLRFLKKGDFLPLTVGALIGAALVSFWYESKGSYYSLVCHEIEWRDRVREGSRKVPMVYFARDVLAGTQISAEDLVIKSIEIDHCPGEAIGDPYVAIGRKAVRTYKKGEWVDGGVVPHYKHLVFGDPEPESQK